MGIVHYSNRWDEWNTNEEKIMIDNLQKIIKSCGYISIKYNNGKYGLDFQGYCGFTRDNLQELFAEALRLIEIYNNNQKISEVENAKSNI